MEKSRNIEKVRDYILEEGTRYWRTTSIISIINRPELNRWRGDIGNTSADMILQETASIGKQLHSLAPEIIKEKGFFVSKKSVSKIVLGMIDSFSSWAIENVLKIKFVEKRLFSKEHKYCGRIDGLYLLKGKKDFDLIDIKTGNTRHYIENLQLSAYAQLCIENGIKIKDRIILEVKRDGSPVKPRLLESDVKQDFYRFLYCKDLYLSMNKII